MPKRKRVNITPTTTDPALTGGVSGKRVEKGGTREGATFSLKNGKVDILQGLVMHENAITEEFENDLISFVQTQCDRGRNGELKKPTYLRASGARSQGNQREAIMYGGFFDFNRARPGKRGLVPPFPPILDKLVNHLMDNHYLPSDVRPDSCIINRYDVGDCIPPHVDHASYYRPISTLSLLGTEPMLVGTKFRTLKSCTWIPSTPTHGKSISLPRRSLLVLGGNSGNSSKHCISSCGGERISITLRKQPGEDWKPEVSELVTGSGGGRKKRKGSFGGESNMGGGARGGTNGANGDGERPKKKSLSGSAKRRKKMSKTSTTGGVEINRNNASDIYANTQHGASSKDATNSVEGKSNDTKKNEKQARRNARRMEKKRAAAASGGP